jgi:NTE family protein
MKSKIGIALSGGGYRATAFHVGTLRALHRLGVLEMVDVLSTISGGSITGAAYCLHKGDFPSFDVAILDAVATKSVIRYVLTSWLFLRFILFLIVFLVPACWWLFLPHSWISLLLAVALVILLVTFQFRLFPVSRVVEQAYNEFFFHDAKLSGLPPKPELAIGATNLQTCRPFTFSPRKMEDSAYAYYNPPIRFKHAEFPVSKAVMASTCVPFAFTPVKIDPAYFIDPNDQRRCCPVLVDGGIYDNQGVHKITQPGSSYECHYVIASDAGNHLPFAKSYNNTFTLLLRTVNVFMVRIKNFQMALHLYRDGINSSKQVAYLSLEWDLVNCIPGFISNLSEGKVAQSVIDAHGIPPAWTKKANESRTQIAELLETRVSYKDILENDLSAMDLKEIRKVGTNLTRIPLGTAQLLARHAANLCELQVRLYCPSLFLTSKSE